MDNLGPYEQYLYRLIIALVTVSQRGGSGNFF
jgi:hypothetical protein